MGHPPCSALGDDIGAWFMEVLPKSGVAGMLRVVQGRGTPCVVVIGHLSTADLFRIQNRCHNGARYESNGRGGLPMNTQEIPDQFHRKFSRPGGTYWVDLWPRQDGLELRISLPDEAVVPLYYSGGELRSRLIQSSHTRARYGNLVMLETISEPLNHELREVTMEAINEFQART